MAKPNQQKTKRESEAQRIADNLNMIVTRVTYAGDVAYAAKDMKDFDLYTAQEILDWLEHDVREALTARYSDVLTLDELRAAENMVLTLVARGGETNIVNYGQPLRSTTPFNTQEMFDLGMDSAIGTKFADLGIWSVLTATAIDFNRDMADFPKEATPRRFLMAAIRGLTNVGAINAAARDNLIRISELTKEEYSRLVKANPQEFDIFDSRRVTRDNPEGRITVREQMDWFDLIDQEDVRSFIASASGANVEDATENAFESQRNKEEGILQELWITSAEKEQQIKEDALAELIKKDPLKYFKRMLGEAGLPDSVDLLTTPEEKAAFRAGLAKFNQALNSKIPLMVSVGDAGPYANFVKALTGTYVTGMGDNLRVAGEAVIQQSQQDRLDANQTKLNQLMKISVADIERMMEDLGVPFVSTADVKDSGQKSVAQKMLTELRKHWGSFRVTPDGVIKMGIDPETGDLIEVGDLTFLDDDEATNKGIAIYDQVSEVDAVQKQRNKLLYEIDQRHKQQASQRQETWMQRLREQFARDTRKGGTSPWAGDPAIQELLSLPVGPDATAPEIAGDPTFIEAMPAPGQVPQAEGQPPQVPVPARGYEPPIAIPGQLPQQPIPAMGVEPTGVPSGLPPGVASGLLPTGVGAAATTPGGVPVPAIGWTGAPGQPPPSTGPVEWQGPIPARDAGEPVGDYSGVPDPMTGSGAPMQEAPAPTEPKVEGVSVPDYGVGPDAGPPEYVRHDEQAWQEWFANQQKSKFSTLAQRDPERWAALQELRGGVYSPNEQTFLQLARDVSGGDNFLFRGLLGRGQSLMEEYMEANRQSRAFMLNPSRYQGKITKPVADPNTGEMIQVSASGAIPSKGELEKTLSPTAGMKRFDEWMKERLTKETPTIELTRPFEEPEEILRRSPRTFTL